MGNSRKQVICDALKYSFVSIPLLFAGFFLAAGVNSYSANITGRFFDAILENQHDTAEGLLGVMGLTLLVCVFLLPLVTQGTNMLFFYFSLKYDLHVTNRFFRKTYENMLSFSGGEIVQKLFRDPGQLLMLLAAIPAKLLALLFRCFLGESLHDWMKQTNSSKTERQVSKWTWF